MTMNISCKAEKYIQKSAHSGLKVAMSSVLTLKKMPRISIKISGLKQRAKLVYGSCYLQRQQRC